MKLNRRNFARFGALGLATGLLPAGNVTAQSAGKQRRLISVFTPLGQMAEWLPDGNSRDLVLSEQCASLAPFKDKLLFIDGTRTSLTLGHDGAHRIGYESSFTGMGFKTRTNEFERTRKPSIDQLVAAHHGTEPLVTGALSAADRATISFLAPRDANGLAQGVAPQTNPAAVFDSLFRDFGRSTNELQRLRRRRASVLDVWNKHLGSLQAEISAESRPILDAHLQQVRELEVKFDSTGGSCDPGTAPSDPANYPETLRQQMDNIASAFACNVTSTAALTFHESGSKLFHRWVTNSNQEHHGLTHNAGPETSKTALYAIFEWQVQQMAYLLGKLAELPESDGSGSLLDNTLVYWSTESGTHTSHNGYNMRTLIAGAGHFQADRYYRTGRTQNMQPSQNDILSEIYSACTGESTTAFDDPRLSTRNEFPELLA